VSRLSTTGIAYVVPSRAVGLRRSLAAGGLRSAEMLLHIPDLAQSRHVVPVGTAAERYALSGQLPMKRSNRLAAAALPSSWRAAVGPTGTVFRRTTAVPLASWLFELERSPRVPGSALVTASGAAAGGSILHRFSGSEAGPDGVAKVSPRATDELQSLLRIAPAAARAGARVPVVLHSGELGSVPLVLQSALAGRSAQLLLEEKRVTASSLQERIAAWLERWAGSTARPRGLSRRDLERFVLSPAAGPAPLASERGLYLDYLRALCSRAVGMTCPLVAGHGDLTAANIVLDGQAELGIVDWEEASEEALPLTDFFYAAADALAATHAYADRPGAVASCFAADGDHAPFVDGLRRRLSHVLGIHEVIQEICFHACWLHHAVNEASRSANSEVGPFTAILRLVAGDPDRFRLADQGR
jgi:hypothetical protein